ncbi:MAG TPA: hypothetical protein VET65_09550, partial [Candidatus Limnocylindrales bacterium]|nr:hypothetical protein [Candidatus Limnocylindrales bacterium]
MNPRLDEIDALANAIDRLIFPGSPSPGGFRGAADADLALISYLNESFPQLSLAGPRRERVRRRM